MPGSVLGCENIVINKTMALFSCVGELDNQTNTSTPIKDITLDSNKNFLNKAKGKGRVVQEQNYFR